MAGWVRGNRGVESAPMFDIGGGEFLMLVVLGLLVFGPRRLPQIGRQFGGWVAQMRRAMNDFRGTLEREVALDDVRKAARQVEGLTSDARRMTQDLVGGIGAPPPADPQRRLRVSRPPAPAASPGETPAGAASGQTAAAEEARQDLERRRAESPAGTEPRRDPGSAETDPPGRDAD